MKKLLCWLLALAMVLTAAGCKKKPEPETPVTTEVPTTVAKEPEVQEVPYEGEEEVLAYEGVTLEFQTVVAESDPEAVAIAQAAEYFETTTGTAGTCSDCHYKKKNHLGKLRP